MECLLTFQKLSLFWGLARPELLFLLVVLQLLLIVGQCRAFVFVNCGALQCSPKAGGFMSVCF